VQQGEKEQHAKAKTFHGMKVQAGVKFETGKLTGIMEKSVEERAWRKDFTAGFVDSFRRLHP
jgi:hypothetical protein